MSLTIAEESKRIAKQAFELVAAGDYQSMDQYIAADYIGECHIRIILKAGHYIDNELGGRRSERNNSKADYELRNMKLLCNKGRSVY